MPTRKPKRTNWKQMYEAEFKVAAGYREEKRVAEVAKEKAGKGLQYWKHRAAEILAERDEALQACTELLKEKTALFDELKSAERHNAELLKEREAQCEAKKDKTVCRGCFRHECHGECMTSVRFHDEVPEVMYSSTSDVIEDFGEAEPTPSWLRRNWVQLTVMATVLGAIGFVVWRAI